MTESKGVRVFNPQGLPDLPGEEWRPVSGWEDLYSVSTFGRVKGHRATILHLKLQWNGYLQVTLCGHGKPVTRTVHRLVAETFLANPEGLPAIDHIDGNKTMNHIANLEWISHGANRQRAIALGLAKKPPRRDGRGSRNASAKLSEEQVREILNAPRGRGMGAKLAEQYSVCNSTISQILRGKRWPHIKPN